MPDPWTQLVAAGYDGVSDLRGWTSGSGREFAVERDEVVTFEESEAPVQFQRVLPQA